MDVQHIWCCPCGVQTECEFEDIRIGRIFQCPACKKVQAAVLTRSGTKVWVTVDPGEVEFYDMVKEPEEEDEDETFREAARALALKT
jgi:hypothetical protein